MSLSPSAMLSCCSQKPLHPRALFSCKCVHLGCVPFPALFRSPSEVCLWPSRQGQPGCYGHVMGRPGSQCPAPAHFIIQSVLQGFQQLPESLASGL